MPGDEQLAQAGGEVGAAEPVHHPLLRQRDRLLGRPVHERRGQPGQRGGERERLRAPGAREGAHQVEVRRGVALHRLADVGHQRDRQRPLHRAVALQLHGLPAGAAGGGDGGPQRDLATRRTHLGAAAAPRRPAVRRLLQPAPEQPELVGVELVEGGVRDPGDGAGQQLRQRAAALVLLPRDGARQRVPGQVAARDVRRRRSPPTECQASSSAAAGLGPGAPGVRVDGQHGVARTPPSKTRSNAARSCWRWTRVTRASQ